MNVVIIDDEKHCRELLKAQINRYCENASILGEADGVKSGYDMIANLNPDIVFLDIQMNDGTGFELLNLFKEINFKLVFTTAFDEYAIKAFKYSAIHYLLKPIDSEELAEAYIRASKEITYRESTNNFIKTYKDGSFETLSLKTENCIYNINVSEIEFIEAEGSYCTFHLENNKTIMVSKPLREYAEILPDSIFVRIHKSYLVNLKQIKSYKQSSLKLTMNSGKHTFISRRNKTLFSNVLSECGLSINTI